ncbi:hypothetical protein CERZMDRAFT_95689 [Cercospora zeae-maydis SCOH1-5]|uniref:Uncharacterized protein n=1 Tax=Cercospora zeae-maydis SCOH1-5 TaxID=717836 RepID=A0A6A6FMI0_9PEZI|nr:hypothetical protein CERZMDRAFT_95689 [Cercospora zeae-maydis SCOH1-5]
MRKEDMMIVPQKKDPAHNETKDHEMESMSHSHFGLDASGKNFHLPERAHRLLRDWYSILDALPEFSPFRVHKCTNEAALWPLALRLLIGPTGQIKFLAGPQANPTAKASVRMSDGIPLILGMHESSQADVLPTPQSEAGLLQQSRPLQLWSSVVRVRFMIYITISRDLVTGCKQSAAYRFYE